MQLGPSIVGQAKPSLRTPLTPDRWPSLAPIPIKNCDANEQRRGERISSLGLHCGNKCRDRHQDFPSHQHHPHQRHHRTTHSLTRQSRWPRRSGWWVAQLLLFIFGREEMAKKRSVPPKVKSKQKCEAFPWWGLRYYFIGMLGGGWCLVGGGWWVVMVCRCQAAVRGAQDLCSVHARPKGAGHSVRWGGQVMRTPVQLHSFDQSGDQ